MGDNFCDFLLAISMGFQKESTSKGKNLLQEEQILSYRSCPHRERRQNVNSRVASPENK